MEYCFTVYETELGDLTLISNGDAIVTVHFGAGEPRGCFNEEDAILIQAILEINQYIAGQRKKFDVPVDPMGSPEEKEVYRYLLENVGYGQFKTYEELAAMFHHSVEEIEEMLRTNSCPILVPCHRVIRQDRRVGSYVTDSKVKTGLLKFEHEHKNKEFVRPDYHDDDEDSAPPID